MTDFKPTKYNYLPPVIKNLIIINVLVFLAELAYPDWMVQNLSLFYFDSVFFKPFQLITHMFMHSPTDIFHIIFNMLALWMFGSVLENVWGPKRFLQFYIITGFGAVFLHQAVEAFQLYQISGSIFIDQVNTNLLSPDQIERIQGIVNSPTLGASGAIFGVLVAFGMLFPNTLIYIYMFIPMKAKYLIIIYIGIELFLGFKQSSSDNVAHFAHLGGALFGFLLVKYYGRDKKTFF